MSPPGRPIGENRKAQPEAAPVSAALQRRRRWAVVPAIGMAGGVGLARAAEAASSPGPGWPVLVLGGLVVVLLVLVGGLWWRLLAERAASRREAARQHALIDGLDIGLVVYDEHDRLSLWNRDFARLYGPLANSLKVGTRFEELVRLVLARDLVPQAAGREEEWVQERLALHRQPESLVLRELPGGRWRRITERRLSDGRLLSYSIDVTELVRRERELQRVNAQLDASNARLEAITATDALTGIANRRLFDRRLSEESTRARRHGLPLALLMIDVDHFKRYNDRHGHQAGDDCLRRVAELLVGAVGRRPTDLVARYGGEEFVVLLPHTGPEEALILAERCLREMEAAALPHGDSPVAPQVTFSIGVAVMAPDGAVADPASLLRAADAALYQAKAGGRHCVALNGSPAQA